MYHLIANFSLFIRQFYLGNPFEALTKTVYVSLYGVQIPLGPEILNMIAGVILPYFTFFMVSLYYEKGSCPPLGSFLFLIFYLIHNEIVELMCRVNFDKCYMIGIIASFLFAHIIIINVKNKLTMRGQVL